MIERVLVMHLLWTATCDTMCDEDDFTVAIVFHQHT